MGRAWPFNGDSGGVWFRERVGSEWVKTYRGSGLTSREIDRAMDQPPAVCPYKEYRAGVRGMRSGVDSSRARQEQVGGYCGGGLGRSASRQQSRISAGSLS